MSRTRGHNHRSDHQSRYWNIGWLRERRAEPDYHAAYEAEANLDTRLAWTTEGLGLALTALEPMRLDPIAMALAKLRGAYGKGQADWRDYKELIFPFPERRGRKRCVLGEAQVPVDWATMDPEPTDDDIGGWGS